MKYLNTLRSSWKALALILGTLMTGYAITGLIAWAGTRYHGSLNNFMQLFRDAGVFLLLVRLAGYGVFTWYWHRWKSRLLADAQHREQTHRATQRIGILALISLVIVEVIVWQSNPAGGAL